MYPLDTRETNILRHALGRDGGSDALDLLGVMPDPSSGHGLSPRQAGVAVRALDGYAGENGSFGAIAVTLAGELRRYAGARHA